MTPETKTKILWYVKEIDWLPMTSHGWGNGYVCLPPDHPLHGKDYDTIHNLIPELSVHGGLTFSEHESKINRERSPETPNNIPDYWIVGFDCAHYMDTLESCPRSYVECEARDLAWQFEQYANKKAGQ